jgi:phage terminase large subunit
MPVAAAAQMRGTTDERAEVFYARARRSPGWRRVPVPPAAASPILRARPPAPRKTRRFPIVGQVMSLRDEFPRMGPAMSERIAIPHGMTLSPLQQEPIAVLESGASRFGFLLAHRQFGKTLTAAARLARAMWLEPCTVVYVAPTYGVARRVFWDARRVSDGLPYRSVFPEQLVEEPNENEMTLSMRCAEPGKLSRLLCLSGEEPGRLRGIAAKHAVFDEFSQFPAGAEAYNVLRPVLAASGGTLLIITTPLGTANHAHEFWRMAQTTPGWWSKRVTVEDSGVVPLEEIEQQRREGQHESFLRQEFWCEFVSALENTYFEEQLRRAEEEGRIVDSLPHRPDRPVTVALDLGVSDATAVVYAQSVGEFVHLIDYDEWTGLGLPEILSRIRAKGYNITRWLAPHDLRQRDLSVGVTRFEVALSLGVRFDIVPRVEAVQESIDAVRRFFPRIKVDRRRCARLLEAAGSYQRVWDARAKFFLSKPRHDWASHGCDALAILARGYREHVDRPRAPIFARTSRDSDPFAGLRRSRFAKTSSD